MTIGTWLQQSKQLLDSVNISTSRLDCLVLLQECLSKDKSWILAHQDTELSPKQKVDLDNQAKRRATHEPLAYIRGKSEFYGREFAVTPATLQPRPETETMVELALDIVNSKELKVNRIIDVGTGSGCISITVKLELPQITVLGTDISKECVQIAERNAKKLNAEVPFYKGNLLEPLPSSTFQLPYAILANLPYVPDSFTINEAAMHEPKLAIFGGHDGLDCYRQLFTNLPIQKPSIIFTESLPTQQDELQIIAAASGYKEIIREDFIQLFER